MVLWLDVRLDLRASGTCSRARASTSGSIALGALLPLVLDAAVRRAGLRAHVARRRSSCSSSTMVAHRGPGPAAPAPARARASRSAGSRASCSSGVVGAQGSVLVAGVRRGASARARCSRRWPVRRRSRSCSASPRRGGRGRGSGCATRRAARELLAHRPARDRGGGAMISFVRHGQTALQPRRPAAGPRSTLELSEHGARPGRARSARGSRRRRSTRVVSSPLRRARQTAAAIAEVCGCDGRGRRSADRARLRRMGRPRRSPRSRPTRGRRWRADPDVRAARRREPRRGHRTRRVVLRETVSAATVAWSR